MSVRILTATGTDVGKTVTTAAVAALAPPHTAVVKLAQTGVLPSEAGDIEVIARLSGRTSVYEFARFSEALSPHHAAARSDLPALTRAEAFSRLAELASEFDTVLVEGSGGALVPFDDTGWTVLDLAADLNADVVLVTAAGLGTLNHTALSVRAVQSAGLTLTGIVIGSWPAHPGLAERCNVMDLAAMSPGGRLAGALPTAMPDVSDFFAEARAALGPEFGGSFDWAAFAASNHS